MVGVVAARLRLEQPDVEEDEDDGGEEGEPDLPAHARPLGHEEHPVHGAADARPRRVERVVHLLHEGRRVADLSAHGLRHGAQDLDLGEDARHLRVVLRLEGLERRRVVLAPVRPSRTSATATVTATVTATATAQHSRAISPFSFLSFFYPCIPRVRRRDPEALVPLDAQLVPVPVASRVGAIATTVAGVQRARAGGELLPSRRIGTARVAFEEGAARVALVDRRVAEPVASRALVSLSSQFRCPCRKGGNETPMASICIWCTPSVASDQRQIAKPDLGGNQTWKADGVAGLQSCHRHERWRGQIVP